MGSGTRDGGAPEALTFGFDGLGLERIIARYRTDNVASGRVMEKIGMRRWQVVPHSDVPGTTTTMYEIHSGEQVVPTA